MAIEVHRKGLGHTMAVTANVLTWQWVTVYDTSLVCLEDGWLFQQYQHAASAAGVNILACSCSAAV